MNLQGFCTVDKENTHRTLIFFLMDADFLFGKVTKTYIVSGRMMSLQSTKKQGFKDSRPIILVLVLYTFPILRQPHPSEAQISFRINLLTFQHPQRPSNTFPYW